MMKLSLGTAQFGSAYGITNTNGLPSEDGIYRILDVFFEKGHSFLDTAQEYGDSHKKINQWYKRKYSKSYVHPNVTTKIHIKSTSDIAFFEHRVEKLCEELGVENLYAIFIHNPSDVVNIENFYQLNDQFKRLKNRGLVKKTGVSVYSPTELLKIYEKISEIDIVQCPANILDQRFLQKDIQTFCKKENIEVHARSLFLQGLLLSHSVPEKLLKTDVRDILTSYIHFLKEHHLKAMEACCLFAHQNQEKIDRWVVGFNLQSELEEFLLQMSAIKMTPNIVFDVFGKNNAYVDPRSWSYIQSC